MNIYLDEVEEHVCVGWGMKEKAGQEVIFRKGKRQLQDLRGQRYQGEGGRKYT